jgi:thiosulfate/3-mercaptopyruvate sulfurtransferase
MKTTLVDTVELAAHPQWRTFDCRHDLADPHAGARAYAQGHIPGALHAPLDTLLSGPRTGQNGRHPLPDPQLLAEWLGQNGVGPQDQVVAYDASGGIYAARLWWLLRWLGHSAVAVLDGGLAHWQQEGRPVTEVVPRFTPVNFQATANSAACVDVDAMVDNLLHPKYLVIDARGAGRYAGIGETMDPRGGHIPGAVNRPYTDNLGPDGRFRAPGELAAAFNSVTGSASDLSVVAQCGSGVTACHNLLAMEIARLPHGRLYAGSWSEWCSNMARPIRTGAEP